MTSVKPSQSVRPMPGGVRAEVQALPNLLTLARIGLIPVVMAFLFFPGPLASGLAAAAFTLASVTDLLDGYLARRRRQITATGRALDPIADKLLVAVALIMLIPMGRVPAWMVALLVGREVVVTGMREIAMQAGHVIPSSWLAKKKTALQSVATVGLLIHYPFLGITFHRIGLTLLWLALAVTLYTGVEYVVQFLGRVRRG